jgi:hypothetical protein
LKVKTSASPRSGLKTVVVLIAMLVAMSLAAGEALATTSITIDKPVAKDGLTVHLSGTAEAPTFSDASIDINWGDGNHSLVALEDGSPWVWGPVDHTYAAPGRYRIVAILLLDGATDRHIRTTTLVSVGTTDGGDGV